MADKKGKERVHLKVLVKFKCSNCHAEWNSVHGWDRDESLVKCVSCDTNAEITVKDGMLKLDCYNCSNESCDGFSWTALHNGPGLPQKCSHCDEEILPEQNPQERFGRHYWFACQNKNCTDPKKWEDYTTDKLYIQRCRKCHSRGEITHIQKIPNRKKRKAKVNSDSAAGHRSDLCDMCDKINRETKSDSCHSFNKVKTRIQQSSGGGQNEVITAISRIQL